VDGRCKIEDRDTLHIVAQLLRVARKYCITCRCLVLLVVQTQRVHLRMLSCPD